MAAGLYGAARTTPRVWAGCMHTRALAAQHHLNPRTVRQWRRRTGITDAPMGPRQPRRSVLTQAEEATVVAFRRRTLLPLDVVLGCLRETIPAPGRG